MNQAVKKWVCIGAGFGAGAVLVVGVLVGAIAWYSNRPKPWDQNSLKAKPEVLWEFWEAVPAYDPQNTTANVTFSYTVQNITNLDITISSPVTIMLNPQSGALIELPAQLYHVHFPSFIPAGKSVQVKLDAPAWYTAGGGKGFILYDKVGRYQINLPEPNGPTAADQKKMNPKP